ncbi:restriction endonuclease subunit S [Paraclostridium sordellii]|uniref:Restriction enzyme BgcI subunit beta n=1 Tax=Paraclostridium sordellii TaxID=1505 RepID=A0A9P1PAJ1_PARSO|nr:restriction endonuclease subunit S [Paeniclostridium sordellii]CEO35898.1 Restriction enzyme BgcI subunit beta [[Clostridium] sordellii] [Paeniclostridium sordellii]
MKKISDLFYLESGNGLALNKLNPNPKGIAFVSRTSKNNGVSKFVDKYNNIIPFSPGLITVALSGNSVLEASVQPFEFYTGYHVMVLTPKKEMSLREKLFYCICIKKNRFKYNFGRQANRTLGDLLVPQFIPENFSELNINKYENFDAPVINSPQKNLDISEWKIFSYEDLFNVEIGKGVLINKAKSSPGKYPLVSATRLNNAISTYTSYKPTHPSNSLIIIKNGVNVGMCFYQPDEFLATSDVAVLIPKFKLDPYVAMFLIALINKDSYRYNYGRKWVLSSFYKSKIPLPINESGEPDWHYMSCYVKHLKYSNSI